MARSRSPARFTRSFISSSEAGTYPSFSHHCISSLRGVWFEPVGIGDHHEPALFQEWFPCLQPVFKPDDKDRPLGPDEVELSFPERESIHRGADRFDPVLYPCFPAHIVMLSRNGWWLSTAVMVPPVSAARSRVWVPEPHPISRIFASAGRGGRCENASRVASVQPGPCRGSDSNTV